MRSCDRSETGASVSRASRSRVGARAARSSSSSTTTSSSARPEGTSAPMLTRPSTWAASPRSCSSPRPRSCVRGRATTARPRRRAGGCAHGRRHPARRATAPRTHGPRRSGPRRRVVAAAAPARSRRRPRRGSRARGGHGDAPPGGVACLAGRPRTALGSGSFVPGRLWGGQTRAPRRPRMNPRMAPMIPPVVDPRREGPRRVRTGRPPDVRRLNVPMRRRTRPMHAPLWWFVDAPT